MNVCLFPQALCSSQLQNPPGHRGECKVPSINQNLNHPGNIFTVESNYEDKIVKTISFSIKYLSIPISVQH